jgi:hypothetical protein
MSSVDVTESVAFDRITHDLRDQCDHCGGPTKNPVIEIVSHERRVRMCNDCTKEFLEWL